MAEVEHFDRVSKNEDLLKKDEQSPAQKLLNESMDYLKVHKDDLMIDAGMALLAVGTVAGIAKAAAKLESSLFRNGFLVSANDMKHELTFGGLSMPENPLGVGSKFGAAKSSEPKLIFDDKATFSPTPLSQASIGLHNLEEIYIDTYKAAPVAAITGGATSK